MRRRLFLLANAGIMLFASARTLEQGDALFHGKFPLSGRIRGHEESLPPETVRCSNCHEAANSVSVSRVAPPRIDRLLLLEPRQRRGGPPSSYDQKAFCKLLRTGIDPAYIVIAREMPTYAVDDQQCASLWKYLLRQTNSNEQN